MSVIVPTRNSAATLERCLRSARNQTYSAVELIVVDNGSEDATVDIAATLADVVVEAGPERSRQRNVGGSRARGAYLAFIDSDMLLEPEVVAQAVEETRNGAAAVVIPEESFGDGFWARCKALERSCYLHDPTVEAARFFTRPLFDALEGFDEGITGNEDWDIHERARLLGAVTARTAAIIRHDEGQLRLRDTVAKKFYYGRSTGAYIRKHPALARRQLRIVRPAFLRHWRRLARQPLVTSGMLVMKTCELAAGAAGLGWSRVGERKR